MRRLLIALALIASPAFAGDSIWNSILSDGVGSDRFCYAGCSTGSRMALGWDFTYGDDSGSDLGKFCDGSRLRGTAAPDTLDGCSMERWADPIGESGTYCYDQLETEVCAFEPEMIVFLICYKPGSILTEAQTIAGLLEFRSQLNDMCGGGSTRGDDMLLMLMGLPRHDETCLSTDYSIPGQTWAHARSIAADPTQPAGPVIIGGKWEAVNNSNTVDNCHGDSSWRQDAAGRLKVWLEQKRSGAFLGGGQ